MKKRLASAVMCACLLVAALPVTAAAEEPQNAQQVTIAGKVLTDGMGWNNDGSTTAHGSKDNNAYFDGGVLYLNDAEIEAEQNAVSVSNGDVIIDVSGENVIVSTASGAMYSSVIFNGSEQGTAGDVTIQGDGFLGIYVGDGGASACALEGIAQDTTMTIRDAVLDAEGRITGQGTLAVCGEAQVSVLSSYNCISMHEVRVSDQAVVALDSADGGGGSAISCDSMQITGGYVLAYGDYGAINCPGDVSVTGGVLEAYCRMNPYAPALYVYSYTDENGNQTGGHVTTTGMEVKAGVSDLDAQPVTDFDTTFKNYGYALIAPSLDALAWENPFADVKETDWFYSAVSYVNEHGMMNGVADTKFAPKGKVSRAQAVQMVYAISRNYPRQYNVHTDQPWTFADVSQNAWYADAAGWGGATGVVSGVGNNRFAPNVNVPREQFATILYSFAQKAGYDVSARASLDSFHDAAKVSGWAQNAMQWAVAEGVMSGTNKGNLNPKGTLTRAEAAAMLRSFVRATVLKA